LKGRAEGDRSLAHACPPQRTIAPYFSLPTKEHAALLGPFKGEAGRGMVLVVK